MNPDSPETRIGRLETAVARLEQRTEDLRSDVKELAPLVVSVAEMRGAMARLQSDLTGVSDKVVDLGREFSQREEERQQAQLAALKDSQKWRRQISLAWIGTFGLALGAAGTVIAAVL
jgi:chromosome segregation ATPase